MLYDPKWEVTTKPNVFSLEGLVAWLEKQNPATSYDYASPHGCLLAKYFRSMGYRWAFCGTSIFHYSRFFLPTLFTKPIPKEMNNVSMYGPFTFGAALERAQRLINKA